MASNGFVGAWTVLNEENLARVEVVDISAGGVAFVSRAGAVIGDALELNLDFEGERLPVRAVVRRCHSKGDLFLIGAEFDCEPELRERISLKVDARFKAMAKS